METGYAFCGIAKSPATVRRIRKSASFSQKWCARDFGLNDGKRNAKRTHLQAKRASDCSKIRVFFLNERARCFG